MYRLSYERRGDISFIARETISYFVKSERSERGTKYDIVTRAISHTCAIITYDYHIRERLSHNCAIITYESDYHILVPLSRAKTRLYFQIIYTSSTFQNEFKMIV